MSINLLPWRTARKRRYQAGILAALFMIFISTSLGTFFVRHYLLNQNEKRKAHLQMLSMQSKRLGKVNDFSKWAQRYEAYQQRMSNIKSTERWLAHLFNSFSCISKTMPDVTRLVMIDTTHDRLKVDAITLQAASITPWINALKRCSNNQRISLKQYSSAKRSAKGTRFAISIKSLDRKPLPIHSTTYRRTV